MNKASRRWGTRGQSAARVAARPVRRGNTHHDDGKRVKRVSRLGVGQGDKQSSETFTAPSQKKTTPSEVTPSEVSND